MSEPRCVICDDDVTERPSVRVDFIGGVAEVCTDCMEKGDDEPVVQRLYLNREGDPAFNGAFNAW